MRGGLKHSYMSGGPITKCLGGGRRLAAWRRIAAVRGREAAEVEADAEVEVGPVLPCGLMLARPRSRPVARLSPITNHANR